MAKIRTLKGEFFRNAGVSRGGLVAKTLAAGLICAVADDEGRFKVKLDDFKGEIFTHDPTVSAADINQSLEKLALEDFVLLYRDHGRAFGVIKNWKDHQPVPPSRYKASVLPAPPNTNSRRHLSTERKHSQDNAYKAQAPEAGIGREGKGNGIGREGNISAASGSELMVLAAVEDSPRVRVFKAWIESTGRTGQTRLDDKRSRLIVDGLSHYPEQDLVDAVRGWRHSPHHRGENDSRTLYNDLELLLRDSKHIEKFRDLERNGTPLVLPVKTKSQQLGDLYREQAARLGKQGQ